VLVERGHEVTVFAASVDGRPAEETVEGVRIVRDGSRLGVYRAARRFWARQPRHSYDVVVDEINTRPFLTPRWLRGAPVVALIHQLAREIWFYETPIPVALAGRYALEPWWLRAYRTVPALTVSQSSADSLRRFHGWRDVTVVPEGHTPRSGPTVEKEAEPTIVFLGRLVEMKRPQDAIDAFSRATDEVRRARMWVIGDGPLLSRLQARAPAGVEFLGRLSRDEVDERLARAHVLVATSVREGWGLNVSEAALCGTASIGYGVPGLVDSIEASGGMTTEPRADALAAALREFLRGKLELRPKVSTVPWTDVGAAVEAQLTNAVEAWRLRAGHATSPRRARGRTQV
jgi:glycosyltransferase involved in cell wall biosynthesis